MTSNFVSEVDGFVQYNEDQWNTKKVLNFKLFVTVIYSNLQYLPVRGWSLCEIMDRQGLDFKSVDNNKGFCSHRKQDKMTVLKKYDPLRA